MRKICLLMFATVLSLSASAYDFEVDGICFEKLSENTVTIVKAPNKFTGDVALPQSVTFDGTEYSVTAIAANALRGHDNMTSIAIPNSVTEIGEYAFHGCYGLTSITLSCSITKIGRCAFEGCSRLTALHISDLENWININFEGFYANPLIYAKNLYLNDELVTDVVIPETMTHIGQFTFQGCQTLKSVVIPNSVTSIGGNAFDGCSSLTSVNIPSAVTEIAGAAFIGCSGLTAVHINDLEKWININFKGFYASPLGYAKNLYLNNELVTDVVIPVTMTHIGQYTFQGCQTLKSVVIPNSVTSIGENAFQGCSSLTSVVLPSSVTSIGNGAFGGCTSMESIVIPNSVTSIGHNAFSWCKSLKSVDIPNSVTSIGIEILIGCNSLESITGKYASDDHRCWIIDGMLESFAPGGLTSYTIPRTVTSLGEYAFYGYSNLESIVIPETVTRFENFSFQRCSGLKEMISLNVTPPEVNSYADQCFWGVPKECCVRVPKQSVQAYANGSEWTYLKNFVALSDEEYQALGIAEMQNAEEFRIQPAYNLQGQPVGGSFRGIVIRGGKKAIAK